MVRTTTVLPHWNVYVETEEGWGMTRQTNGGKETGDFSSLILSPAVSTPKSSVRFRSDFDKTILEGNVFTGILIVGLLPLHCVTVSSVLCFFCLRTPGVTRTGR